MDRNMKPAVTVSAKVKRKTVNLNVLCDYLKTVPRVYDAFSYEKTDVVIVCFVDSSTIVFTHASAGDTAASFYFPTMRSTSLYDWGEYSPFAHPYYFEGCTTYDKSFVNYDRDISHALDSMFDENISGINRTVPVVTAAYAQYLGGDTLTKEEKRRINDIFDQQKPLGQ